MGSYLVGSKPFIKPELNKIEIFNEFIYLQITILMMTLAYSNRDASQDPIIKNQVGMIIISLILLLFAINLVFVLRDLYLEQVLNFKRKQVIKKEKSRLQNLKKLAEKQVNEETKFDKKGKKIPRVELGEVEWQMEKIKKLENKQEEEKEVDDLYYEVKNDEEFAEKMKERKKKHATIGKMNKKLLQAKIRKLDLEVIEEED
jgi:hypothetical protein